MTVEDIIANKESIYFCAKALREDANKLMRELSEKFEFDLNECGAWPLPVYKTNYNN